MGEVQIIGFGICYFLAWPQLTSLVAHSSLGVAQYLLCTPGVPLYAADAMRLGLAQLRVSDQPELTITELLRATGRWDYHTVAETLMHAQDLLAGQDPSEPCTLTDDRLKWIEECFGVEMDLEQIVFNLETFKAKHSSTPSSTAPKSSPHHLGPIEAPETPYEWANKTLCFIQGLPPTALKVSLELLRRTQVQDLSLSEVLQLEFRALMRMLRQHDFQCMLQKHDNEWKEVMPSKPIVPSLSVLTIHKPPPTNFNPFNLLSPLTSIGATARCSPSVPRTAGTDDLRRSQLPAFGLVCCHFTGLKLPSPVLGLPIPIPPNVSLPLTLVN